MKAAKGPSPVLHEFRGDWAPHTFHSDPTTNALYNIAASLDKLAQATQGLLYGLKYGQREGLSIAEAIEVSVRAAGEEIGGAVREAGDYFREAPDGIAPVPSSDEDR